MSFQDLPPELISAILRSVKNDRRLLCHVSLTCRALQAHAENLLYSKIVIEMKRSDILTSFAETVMQNPRLGQLVKGFSGPILSSARKSRRPHLDGWFEKLVNLRELHLLSSSPGTLPKCGSIRLIILELDGCYTFSEVEKLLIGQEDMNYLRYTDFRFVDFHPLSPLACPNLEVFSGSLRDAQQFFPGRNIRRFSWRYLHGEPGLFSSDVFPRISPQLANLRSLCYVPEGLYNDIYPLHDLADHLTSLRFLHVRNIYPSDWLAISKLKELRALLVLEPPYFERSVLRQVDHIMDLFTQCPLLEFVDIGGRESPVILTCWRWLRGATKPFSIPVLVAELGKAKFMDD